MAEENPNLQRIDHPRGGHGFLNTENTVTYREEAMKVVAPGLCPRCSTPATPWSPPINDPRYKNRVETLCEIHGINEQQAYYQYLKDEGGYIAACAQCQTSFWVPASVAKVKE
jgi:hypothetical protein